MEPLSHLLFTFFIVFLASVFQTITGFGIAVMLVPFFLQYLPLSTSAVYGLIFTIIACLLTVASTYRSVALHLIKWMFVAAVPGIFGGLYLIQFGNEIYLKKLVGLITLAVAVGLLLGFARPVRDEKKASAAVGFLSGVLSGSFGLPGPPVTLFWVNQAYEKEVFRSSLSAYFFLVSSLSLVMVQVKFQYPTEIYIGSIKYIISLVAGFGVGHLLSRYVSVKMVYKAALILTAVLGLTTLLC